jgi:hypothetical protein
MAPPFAGRVALRLPHVEIVECRLKISRVHGLASCLASKFYTKMGTRISQTAVSFAKILRHLDLSGQSIHEKVYQKIS